MTVVLNKPADFDPTRWSAMPGWSITVDLTPPELRTRRSLALLRRVIAAVLAFVILLCVGGYLLAVHANSTAQDALDAASSHTTSIRATLGQHSAVTQVKAATSAIDTQLAALFTDDVDVPKLIADLPDADPSHLTVTSVNLSVTDDPGPATPGSPTTIGTVTMSGTARHLADLATEVKALNGVRGVTNVIPTTNSTSGTGTSWSLTFQLTDALYTHRFAATAASAAASATSGASTTSGGK